MIDVILEVFGKRGIIHRGDPFQVKLPDAERPTTCSAMIAGGPFYCNIALVQEAGYALCWGREYPVDLVAYWRATLILQSMQEISKTTFRDAYIAASLSKNKDEKGRAGVLIGEDDFARIMNTPIPGHILEAILDPPGGIPMYETASLTEEVRVGRLTWSKKLEEAGVMHPREEAAYARRHWRALLFSLPLLASYFLFRQWKKEMPEPFTNALAYLWQSDVKGSKSLKIALAGLFSDLALAEAENASERCPDHCDGDIWRKKRKIVLEDALERAAIWHGMHPTSLGDFWSLCQSGAEVKLLAEAKLRFPGIIQE